MRNVAFMVLGAVLSLMALRHFADDPWQYSVTPEVSDWAPLEAPPAQPPVEKADPSPGDPFLGYYERQVGQRAWVVLQDEEGTRSTLALPRSFLEQQHISVAELFEVRQRFQGPDVWWTVVAHDQKAGLDWLRHLWPRREGVPVTTLRTTPIADTRQMDLQRLWETLGTEPHFRGEGERVVRDGPLGSPMRRVPLATSSPFSPPPLVWSTQDPTPRPKLDEHSKLEPFKPLVADEPPKQAIPAVRSGPIRTPPKPAPVDLQGVPLQRIEEKARPSAAPVIDDKPSKKSGLPAGSAAVSYRDDISSCLEVYAPAGTLVNFFASHGGYIDSTNRRWWGTNRHLPAGGEWTDYRVKLTHPNGSSRIFSVNISPAYRTIIHWE